MLLQVHDIAVKGTKYNVLPLSTVQFEGRGMPAPAKPEVFCCRAPTDPTGGFPTPRSSSQHLEGTSGALGVGLEVVRQPRDFWGRQYAGPGGCDCPRPEPVRRVGCRPGAAGMLVERGMRKRPGHRFFAELGWERRGSRPRPCDTQVHVAVLKEMEPDQRPEILPFNLESLRRTPRRRSTGQLQSGTGHGVQAASSCTPSASAHGNTSGGTRSMASGRRSLLPRVPDREGLPQAQGLR